MNEAEYATGSSSSIMGMVVDLDIPSSLKAATGPDTVLLEKADHAEANAALSRFRLHHQADRGRSGLRCQYRGCRHAAGLSPEGPRHRRKGHTDAPHVGRVVGPVHAELEVLDDARDYAR